MYIIKQYFQFCTQGSQASKQLKKPKKKRRKWWWKRRTLKKAGEGMEKQTEWLNILAIWAHTKQIKTQKKNMKIPA